MKTPTNSSQISQSWVEYMLSHYESKSNPDTIVTVDYFTFTNATKPGESFNAELVKMDVNAKLKAAGRPPEDKSYHLIVKFLSQDPFNREMIRKVGYHVREFQMYSEVIHKLNEFQASQTNNAFPIHIPEYIYGKCTRKDYVLVINNMKELGYEVNPKEKGLSLEQAKLAMERVARLHGVSYAYNKQHPFLTEFPCFSFSRAISRLFKAVVYASVDNALPFLRTQEGCEEIVESLEKGKERLPEKFAAMWDDQSRHALLCLTHGDFWCNNLLFLSSDQGLLTNLSIIDWQITQWNSPVMDLHYLLATSTTSALRADHLSSLLLHYHSTFTAVTTALKAPAPHWSLEEFRVEFDSLSLVGLLMGLCLIQGTLSKAGEKINQQSAPSSALCSGACVMNGLKSAVAKVAVPLAFHPSCNVLMKLSVKRLLKPIGRELLEGHNPLMNTRLLELVKEGQQNGLFEVLNL
ncbi:UNVERIFIED_CONTAM: hypothetical protein GTU68_009832 [Idotea baltica]|nr:hypothetical protein [Idotea baltica]